MEYAQVVTDTHRELDSRGIVVELDVSGITRFGTVTRWRLTDGDEWHATNLDVVQAMFDDNVAKLVDADFGDDDPYGEAW